MSGQRHALYPVLTQLCQHTREDGRGQVVAVVSPRSRVGTSYVSRTLALLAAFALAAYIFRQPIVERFPSTSTIYKSFGIDVAQSGLTFQSVQSRAAIVEGVPTLIVDGVVQNLTAEGIPAKSVLLSLHNAGGDELMRWIVELPNPNLSGRAKQSFVTSYPNPPIDASILRYQFADEDALATQTNPPERLSLATASGESKDDSPED